MLQGKQRQPRISQQAVHATCVLLALTLAVYSALKVHLILDTRNNHSQSFSLRQALPRHFGVEPEADPRPHAAGECSTALCVLLRAQGAADAE